MGGRKSSEGEPGDDGTDIDEGIEVDVDVAALVTMLDTRGR